MRHVSDLRGLLAGGQPLVAASFGDADPDELIARSFAAGLDVAELRVDWYGSCDAGHVLGQVARFAGHPTLATIRAASEGGSWTGSEQQRRALFAALLPRVGGIDVELSASGILADVVAAARAQEGEPVVVVSHHDFAATPPRADLESLAARARQAGADLVKIATMAHGPADLRRLAAFTLDNAESGVIVIAMGPHGAASRVFFPALGSRLTYTAVGPRQAPGQLSLDDTVGLMRRFYPDLHPDPHPHPDPDPHPDCGGRTAGSAGPRA